MALHFPFKKWHLIWNCSLELLSILFWLLKYWFDLSWELAIRFWLLMYCWHLFWKPKIYLINFFTQIFLQPHSLALFMFWLDLHKWSDKSINWILYHSPYFIFNSKHHLLTIILDNILDFLSLWYSTFLNLIAYTFFIFILYRLTHFLQLRINLLLDINFDNWINQMTDA